MISNAMLVWTQKIDIKKERKAKEPRDPPSWPVLHSSALIRALLLSPISIMISAVRERNRWSHALIWGHAMVMMMMYVYLSM